MKRARTKRAAHPDQGTLPDLSAAKVAPQVRRQAARAVQPKRQKALWTGIKKKSMVSQLQLHLPGMGGVIQ